MGCEIIRGDAVVGGGAAAAAVDNAVASAGRAAVAC